MYDFYIGGPVFLFSGLRKKIMPFVYNIYETLFKRIFFLVFHRNFVREEGIYDRCISDSIYEQKDTEGIGVGLERIVYAPYIIPVTEEIASRPITNSYETPSSMSFYGTGSVNSYGTGAASSVVSREESLFFTMDSQYPPGTISLWEYQSPISSFDGILDSQLNSHLYL